MNEARGPRSRTKPGKNRVSNTRVPPATTSAIRKFPSRRRIEEMVALMLMRISLGIVILCLAGMIGIVTVRGAASLEIEMMISTSENLLVGKGGGILNAIAGSLMLAVGATIPAFGISLLAAMHLQRDFSGRRTARAIRLCLDVLWGIPSIVYGVFCFLIMVALGMSTSLLAGIIALTLLEIPIMTRGIDEALRSVPEELREVSMSLGASRLQTSFGVILRQALPGVVSAVLLALGRAMGDAASILFTAGFSDLVPHSLTDSAASLPTLIFFLANNPSEDVRAKAYASSLVLLALVLIISATSRLVSRRLTRFVVK